MRNAVFVIMIQVTCCSSAVSTEVILEVVLEQLAKVACDLQDQWYPDLKRTVKKIDTTFQRNFKDIGCAGEVGLAEHADYDKFAVQIK